MEPQAPDITPSRWSRDPVVEEHNSGSLMTVSEATTPSLTVRLIRPADQLDLLLELLDVTLDPVTNQLEGVAGGDPRLRVILGAQHTSEDALADVAVETPLKSRTAGPSRLVTSIQTPIAFTVDALLDTAAWVLDSPTSAGTPSDDLTALELPSGLLLAPDATTSVTTTGGPRTHNGVTELWRADLRSPTSRALPLLALANVAPADGVDNAVPDSSARDGIVDNTTAVAPATAPRLTLSSHGAFARLVGDWPDEQVSRRRQTIVTGRDVVAEVVQEGYLLPFGHRVKILQVNSRSFVPDADGQPVAVLEHERFVSIDAPTVVFDDASGAGDAGMNFRQFEGRGLPFTLERPWYSSGEEERLAVVLDQNPSGVPDRTRWGRDPLVATSGSLPTPAVTDFPAAAERVSEGSVDVAAHEVRFDEDRGLWFTDVVIGAELGERPFVQLALARFQPIAVEGLALSGEVQPDPVRLGPRRRVRAEKSAPLGSVLCSVDFAPEDHGVQVLVQQADADIVDPDLRWSDVVGDTGTMVTTLTAQLVGGTPRHSGQVELPTVDGDLRLVFEDLVPVTRTDPNTGDPIADHEVVYRETIEIPADWRV